MAAFQLLVSVPFFPAGAVFCCVVDPGVGSARRALWARTKRHQFLAPDNGLLSWLPEPVVEWRELSNEKLRLSPVSGTFHGRDVFAPAAAALAAGLSPAKLGPKIADAKRLPFPSAAKTRGEILFVDRFGNAITNLRAADVPAGVELRFRSERLGPVGKHYAERPVGKAMALAGSSGFVELSVRDGSFAERFGARIGETVESA
jgi:S-adenosylmethionine hydrolase